MTEITYTALVICPQVVNHAGWWGYVMVAWFIVRETVRLLPRAGWVLLRVLCTTDIPVDHIFLLDVSVNRRRLFRI